MVVAATGFFDGVHVGHQAVLDCLVKTAQAYGAKSEVISFWPHPRTVLQKDAARFRLLTSLEEKRERILQEGVDDFHVIPFTKAFSQVSTRTFFRDYLKEVFQVEVLVAGYNHRLGKDAPRSVAAMQEEAYAAGLKVVEVPEFMLPNGDGVSSTKIRAALSEGLVETAAGWLGYPYQLHGVVVEGNKIGRTMGFPTANMCLYEPLKQLPANGVYHVEVQLQEGTYQGMTNIGFRPTMGNHTERTIETHIFDFDEDIYGCALKIQFLKRLRPEIAFPSLDALREQLRKDKEALLF